jgi:Ca2+-binding RTX toxin-like protein
MRRMRRAVALAVLGLALLTLGAGAVWAETLIACPNVPGTDQCLGTSHSDIMTGTAANDSIAGLQGRERINDAAKRDIDTISGGADNDTINVREGNVGLNNRDLVDCGAGQRDRVFFDAGDSGDKVVRCEIKNPS